MNKFEITAKNIEKEIKKSMEVMRDRYYFIDGYYFRYSLEQKNEALSKLTEKIVQAQKDAYRSGWDAGRQALVQELQKGIGGHK